MFHFSLPLLWNTCKNTQASQVWNLVRAVYRACRLGCRLGSLESCDMFIMWDFIEMLKWKSFCFCTRSRPNLLKLPNEWWNIVRISARGNFICIRKPKQIKWSTQLFTPMLFSILCWCYAVFFAHARISLPRAFNKRRLLLCLSGTLLSIEILA